MRAAFTYLLAVLLAQLTATLIIPLPFGGQVALGTFVFGITFTQRDRMHRYGRPFVYKIILLAGLLSLGLLWACGAFLANWLISASEVLTPVGGFQTWLVEGFGFLGESNLRIFAASFTAIIIAESLDTEIYHKVLKHRWFWRVCRSNSISVPTDTVLFNGIAFLGIFGWPLLLAMTATEIFVKWGVGLIYALFRGEPDERAAASWAETVSRNPQD